MKVEIGNATLYLGDCMDVLPTLPKVDAVITSPPYNFGGFNRNGRKSAYLSYSDDLEDSEYKEWVGNILEALPIKEGGAIYWNFKGKYVDGVYKHPWWVADVCRHRLIQEIIWKFPSSPDVAKIKWYPRIEYIFFFSNGKPDYFHPESAALSNVWEFSHMENNAIDHPAPFPIALPSRCISGSTRFGEVVLDPFLGSGTTGVAAIQLGRKFIGIEREPKYFDIACKRIEQAVAQGQLFAPEPVKQLQTSLL
jgi:DNA modification methylase